MLHNKSVPKTCGQLVIVKGIIQTPKISACYSLLVEHMAWDTIVTSTQMYATAVFSRIPKGVTLKVHSHMLTEDTIA